MNLHIPPILAGHTVMLGEFFEGMVFKLAVNAFKDEVVAKDIPILIERLIAELEEMKAEVEVAEGGHIRSNALTETFDMGNFCYLLFWFMRQQGVLDEREQFINENFKVDADAGRIYASKNRSGSRYREGQEIEGTYRNGRCYIRVQHALTGVAVSLPRDHIVWWKTYGEWPSGPLIHCDGNESNDGNWNLAAPQPDEVRKFPFVAQYRPRGKENNASYGKWCYQRRYRGVLVKVGYWDTDAEAAEKGLAAWKKRTREMCDV